jgi:hypothetical protein
MPKNSLDHQIRERIDGFAQELAELVRQAALESVQDALSTGSRPARRGASAQSSKAAGKRAVSGGRKRRGRRSAGQVDVLATRVLDAVRSGPGRSVGELATELGVTSKDLRSPLLRLQEEKKVRTTGQKRGTKYHAGGRTSATTSRGGRKAGAKRKKAKARARKSSRSSTKRAMAA